MTVDALRAARRHLAAALVVCSTLALAAPAHAQRGEASITMSVSSENVEVGEPFVLEIEIESVGDTIADVTLPRLDGFQVLARQVSQPTQVTWGPRGPIIRRSVVHALRLVAERPGRFDFAPATARVGRAVLRSEAISVKVTGEAAQPGASDPGAPPPPGGDAAEYDDIAFVRTVVDNPSPWVGQQVTVTVYLYSRASGTVHMPQPPTTDGFWIQDLLDPSRPHPEEIQTVRGRPFRVHVIKRFAAFPLRPGRLTIGATTITLGGGVSLFGGPQEIRRTGVPITLDARPLPTPGPANALVGRFEARATLEPTTVRTGEAATITLSIRGVGNLRDARTTLPSLPGLRVDPPDVTDRDETSQDLLAGERLFRWLAVPEQPGRFTIPDFAIDVFDPGTGTYAVLHTDPLSLEAIGPAVATTSPDDDAVDDVAEPETPETAHGLEIRGTSELTRARPRVSDAPFFAPAVALPPIVFLGFLAARALRDGMTRRREAIRGDRRREARRLLADARAKAKANDAAAFYASIARALGEAIEARLGAPIGSMTHAELEAVLVARAMEEDLVRRIIDELEGSDFARFSATGSSPDELSRALERAEALLVRIERFTPLEVA